MSNSSVGDPNALSPPIDVRIVSATIADLDAVCHVERCCFHTPWTEDAFRSELTQLSWSKTILAIQEKDVIGFASYWVVADEIQIMKVAVLPEFRHASIGSGLLCSIIDEGARMKMHSISLELRQSNLAARRLYEKFQFQITGTRPGYYTDTAEDAILMNFTYPR